MYPPDVIRCPIHGVTDCSPVLNGCYMPSKLAEAYDTGQRARVADVRAELEAMLSDDTHIAWLRPNGYGLRHGFPCRKDGLIGCPVDRALAALTKPPAVDEGYYLVTVNADGALTIGNKVASDHDPVRERMDALIESLT